MGRGKRRKPLQFKSIFKYKHSYTAIYSLLCLFQPHLQTKKNTEIIALTEKGLMKHSAHLMGVTDQTEVSPPMNSYDCNG